MNDYLSSFHDYLTAHSYPEKNLEDIIIKSRQLTFHGVAVKNDAGQVIQAFALMGDDTRVKHRLYPFYRTRNWGKGNGNVFPSCSVATQGADGTWTVYDAHDTSKERNEDYLDYNAAVKRFQNRVDAEPGRVFNRQTKVTCWVLAALLLVYFAARLLWPSLSLPLDTTTILLFALVSVLVLLPSLIPFLKSLSFFGIDLIFGKD